MVLTFITLQLQIGLLSSHNNNSTYSELLSNIISVFIHILQLLYEFKANKS